VVRDVAVTFHMDAAGNVAVDPIPMTVCAGGTSSWTPQVLEVDRGFSIDLAPDPMWYCMDGPIHFWGEVHDRLGRPTLDQHCDLQYRDTNRIVQAYEHWTFVAYDNNEHLHANFPFVQGTEDDCWNRTWGNTASADCQVDGDLHGAASVSCTLQIPYWDFDPFGRNGATCLTKVLPRIVTMSVTNLADGHPVLLGSGEANRYVTLRMTAPKNLVMTSLKWVESYPALWFEQDGTEVTAPLLPR
jgi:hypothetical protein